MTLITRRIIYGLAFVLFFVVAPLIAGYAAGYRYDFASNTLVKVGALYVKSFPAASEIYIDGEFTGSRTPKGLLNLRPGEYNVEIRREGFQSWSKRLPVESGTTNFARDIVLFLAQPLQETIAEGGTLLYASPSKDLFMYKDAKGFLHFTNISSGNSFKLTPPRTINEIHAVSPDKSQIVASDDRGFFIFDLNTEESQSLQGLSPSTISRILWDRQNAQRLWILRSETLSTYDLVSDEQGPWLNNVTDFYVSRDHVVVLTDAADSTEIAWRDILSKNVTYAATLPLAKTLGFLEVSENRVVLEREDGTYIVMPAHTGQPFRIDALFVSLHGQRLLYGNQFEVRLYELDNQTDILVDRTSQEIRSLSWHPSGSYYIIQKNDNAEIVELDERDHRNVYVIPDSSEKADFYFDARGSKLYMLNAVTNRRYTVQ